MTQRDDSKPIGWVMPTPAPTPQETLEVKAQAAAWLEFNGALLTDLHASIAADLEAENGDSLMLWWKTLHGLADELHGILTHKPVEVVPDAVRQ